MSAENQESKQYPVDAIHYYPKDKRLVIEVEGGLSFALTQSPEGLLAQLLLNQAAQQRSAVLKDDVVLASEVAPAVSPTAESVSAQPAAPLADAASPATQAELLEEWGKGEQRQFTGRLKAKPKEGRTDSSGLPTAWAPLAAHQDGNEEALMLSASFHKATRRVALGLSSGDQITVRGYYRNSDSHRMDSLRVFMFINYPGKSSKSGS